MSDDDLRGSAPVYSAKEILARVDERTERMDKALTVLLEADLPHRVTDLEAFKNRQEGGEARVGSTDMTIRSWGQVALLAGAFLISIVAMLVK